MKLRLLLVSALLALAACTTPTGSPIPVATFNDKAAAAERTVLLVQTSATSLLQAKKITLAQDQLIQRQVELVHTGLVLAKSLQASDPVNAAAQLTSAITQLQALQQQVGVPK